MKAMAQGFPYEFSKAKKVVASVVAAALVISFGNFALGGGKAIADDGTVEVRFNITAPGATVTLSTGEKFTAESDDNLYQAPTDADLSFTAVSDDGAELKVTHDAPEPVEPQVQTMGSKQPSGNLVVGEPSSRDGSEDNSNANEEAAPEPEAEAASEEDAPVELSPVVRSSSEDEPIASTAEIFKQKAASGEEPVIVGQEDESAVQAEVMEDEAVPMAATPLAATGADEAVVETVVTPDDEGNYIIPAAALAAAAAQDAVIVVTIAAANDEGTIGSWDELTAALTGDETEAKLNKDIVASSDAITVAGTKTLDLNGHDITAQTMDNLFVVPEGASFTITDTSEKAVAKDVAIDDPEFDGKKIPSPADDLDGFKKMVGKKAVYEPNYRTLQYYVTKSYTNRPVKGQTEEYLYEHMIDLSAAGAIEVAQGKTLVQVNGGTLNVQGGRLTLIEGEHAIAMDGGTLTVDQNGFLTGSKGIDGAAINAQKATIIIDGNAVIAGNMVADDNNGGVIWIDKSDLTIQGKALLAANQAGEKVFADTTPGDMAGVRNGGAIYVNAESNVTIAGESVLAGNVANADGGAVYVQGRLKSNFNQKKSVLTVKDNAVITNNRSENDKSAIHPQVRPDTNKDVNWKQFGGGGGGILSKDETVIDGAQLTGNYASDGVGALLITGHGVYTGAFKQYVYPLLKMETGVVASNYAGTSEGGGICATTDKSSYISSGYLTNNVTDTDFDYGGGGLFLPSATHGKETGVTVRYPLVTGNTARGFGGGVGVCTNGVVVTSDAAIFDNTALQKNATTNPNEYGDQWAFDFETYGLKIEDNASDDFFCAKESTVFNAMLGGGYHRWTGYTNGTITYVPDREYKGTLSAWRDRGWENGVNRTETGLTLDGKDLGKVTNVLFDPQTKEAEIYIPALHAGNGDFKDYYVTIEVKKKVNDTYPKGKWSGKVESCREGSNSTAEFKNYFLKLDTSAKAPGTQELVPFDGDPQKLVASTRTESEQEYLIYHVTDPDKFPKYENAMLKANRFTALKANPIPGYKEKAIGKAVLFVTGNYSNTNGGGMARNDRIVVGRDPEIPDSPDESNPEEPKNHTAALTLTKSLDKFDAASGSATAVFNVTGYIDKISAEKKVKDLMVYANTIGFTFNAATGEQSLTEQLTNLPEGYYVIEEAFYSGDGFETKANRWAGWVKFDPAENSTDEVPVTAPVEVSFENTFDDEDKNFGTGVVNKYADENGTLTWAPDSNYNARQQALEEGR